MIVEAECSRCGHRAIIDLRSPPCRPLLRKAVDKTAYLADWLKQHAKQEQAMVDDMLPLFKDQSEAAVKAFEDHYGSVEDLSKYTTADAIARTIFTPDKWVEPIKDAARKSMAKTMALGAQHEWRHFAAPTKAAIDVGLSFDFGVDLPDDILDGLQTELDAILKEDYWAGIADTQLGDLGRALEEGLTNGRTPRDLAKDVQDVFDGAMGKERARRIARSESTGSLSAGQHQARLKLEEEGIVAGKEWLSTIDALTRPAHARAYGQERKVTEDFVVGGERGMYPGDRRFSAGNRVNCRCASVSVTDLGKSAHVATCEAHECGVKAWPYEREA